MGLLTQSATNAVIGADHKREPRRAHGAGLEVAFVRLRALCESVVMAWCDATR